MIKNYDVYGNQETMPPDIEVNIDTVYIRENIRRITLISNRDGKESEYWCYDETQYTLHEYIAIINELGKRQDNAEPLVERMKTATEVFEENKVRDDISLDSLKTLRILKLKEECTSAIFTGFKSSSTEHSFGFNDLDQTNFTQQMLLIVASQGTYSEPILWKTLEGTIESLSAAQFTLIVQEAEQHKRTEQTKYWDLEFQVLAANTIEEVSSILW